LGIKVAPGTFVPVTTPICDLLRVERLTIEEQFRVELARPPGLEHIANILRCDACVLRRQSQQICHWVQVRGSGHNRADIQVPVRKPVDSPSDSGCNRIVYCRMAERTGKSDFGEGVVVESANYTQHGIPFD
jgi:hypothetical protein